MGRAFRRAVLGVRALDFSRFPRSWVAGGRTRGVRTRPLTTRTGFGQGPPLPGVPSSSATRATVPGTTRATRHSACAARKRQLLAAVCLLCSTVWLPSTLSPSRAFGGALEPSVEIAVEGSGGVDFGQLAPSSPPRTLTEAVYIAVKTQRFGPWNLTVNATGDFSAGEGGPTFSIGNLEIAGRLNGQPAPFQRCSTSPVTLVSDGPVTGGIVAMDYRLGVGYEAQVPSNGAEYRADLVYTTSFGTLSASYVDPNPFDPAVHKAVSIKYHYSQLGYPYVLVQIVNSLGRVVYARSFPKPPDGWYTEVWDGRDTTGSLVPSGIYSYSISSSMYTVAGGFINVQRSTREVGTQDNSAMVLEPARFLELSSWAQPASAAIGDIVTIGASLRNVSGFDLEKAQIVLDLPRWLHPLTGTGGFESGGTRPVSTVLTDTRVLWDIGTLDRGSSVRLSLKAVLGPGARPGERCEIRASASAAYGKLIVRSQEADAAIATKGELGLNSGVVVGTVFTDVDGDGKMNEGELPAQGVLVSIDGLEAGRSDSGGRFVANGLSPGDHVVQIAEETLPVGWKPRSTLTLVSVAAGETAWLDIPLQQATSHHTQEGGLAQPPGPALAAFGSARLRLEAGRGYSSWEANGSVGARTQAGLELNLNADGHVARVAHETLNGRLGAWDSERAASAQASLAVPLGHSARLIAALSADSEGDGSNPGLSVGMEVAPVSGVRLAAGYDTKHGVPRISGAWDTRLSDSLTLTTGADITGGSGLVAITPSLSVAYTGPAGSAARFAITSLPRPAAEIACSLRLNGGLTLSLSHCLSFGQAGQCSRYGNPGKTVLGLWWSPVGKTPLTLAASYEPASGAVQGSLLLDGSTPADWSWQASIRASAEPCRESLSLRAHMVLPNRFKSMAAFRLDGERTRSIELGETKKVAAALTISVALGSDTTASALLSMKEVEDSCPPVSARVRTNSISIWAERQVAPRLSLGAGGSWTHLGPEGAHLMQADTRATYDLMPGAKLVLGYRAALGGTGTPRRPFSVEDSWPRPGPYVRLVLVSGWRGAGQGEI